jgi:hypothetical protein
MMAAVNGITLTPSLAATATATGKTMTTLALCDISSVRTIVTR